MGIFFVIAFLYTCNEPVIIILSHFQRDDNKQPFSYTPFKSGTLSRPPSATLLRGGTPNPQISQAGLPEIYVTPTGFYFGFVVYCCR